MKSGYDHYMQKEIHEQPESIRQTMRGRLDFHSLNSSEVAPHTWQFISVHELQPERMMYARKLLLLWWMKTCLCNPVKVGMVCVP